MMKHNFLAILTTSPVGALCKRALMKHNFLAILTTSPVGALCKRALMKHNFLAILTLGLSLMFLTPGHAAGPDVNADGVVNILDLTLVVSHLGQSVPPTQQPNPDATGDGIVDIRDLQLVSLHFGETVSPSTGGTLIFGRGGDSIGLDPGHAIEGESIKVCDNVYDTLVQYSAGTTELEPALAESWENSADGLTWTFHLRRGVTFHDGTPFNAEAVLFSLNRQHEPTHPFHNVGGAYYQWESTGLRTIVDKITALDEFTVQFHLHRMHAPFIYDIASTQFAIISPTAAQQWGEAFAEHPVGTGPFKFVQWVRNDKIVLEANDAYWGGRPVLDRVIFRAIPNNSVRLLELQNGNLHVMEFPNPDDLPEIQRDARLELLMQSGLNVGYLAMNMDKPPFDNLKVRQGINHAINKAAIVEQLYQGTAIPAKVPIPPTLWSYDDTIEDVPYNPALAKQLLAEAGYPNGFETTLWALPVPRPYIPDGRMLAAALQSDLRNVGIKAEIVTFDWVTYLEKTRNGGHDMALLGWLADTGDPDTFFFPLLSKTAAEKPAWNIAFYRSDEMQTVLEQARTSTMQAERIALYQQAQAIFHSDAPWVPIAHAQRLLVINKNVNNLHLPPLQWKYLRHVSLAK